MKFETVRKVERSWTNTWGDLFVEEKAEESYLLMHFLRHNQFRVFHDFPVLSGFERRLQKSYLEGPLASAPEIGTQHWDSDASEEILNHFFPVIKYFNPFSFVEVELRQYGTRPEEIFSEYMHTCHGGREEEIHTKGVMDIGLKSVENIRNSFEPKIIEFDSCGVFSARALMNDCAVNFSFHRRELYRTSYPRINVRIFGGKGTTETVVKNLGLDGLKEVFGNRLSDYALGDSLQMGFAYNDILMSQVNLDDTAKSLPEMRKIIL